MSSIEFDLFAKWQRETVLKKCLERVRAKGYYDYIFIDCPPSLGMLTINALAAADSVLIPIQCEYYALEGLSQLMATLRQVKRLYNEQLDLEGVLLTMYDGRTTLSRQVAAEVRNYFG